MLTTFFVAAFMGIVGWSFYEILRSWKETDRNRVVRVAGFSVMAVVAGFCAVIAVLA